MTTAGTCPHPEKRRWPVRDAPGGLACPCGHAWEPYLFVGIANRFFHHEDKEAEAHRRLEVYQCRAAETRAPLDHFHTTDRGKREAPQDRLDSMVKGTVTSGVDIQKTGWNRRRKPRPMTREERRRMRRWHRI